MKCMHLFWNMVHASLLTTDKGSSWESIRSVEKLQLCKGRSSHSISFLFGAVDPGFKFMSPDSNRINLKYDPHLFKWILDSASWDSGFRNIFFSICSKVQNVLYVKNSSLFSFFNVLKKKCNLSLPVVLFINSVTNRCISNTLSTFNWQHFLPTEFLRLNDFLFAPLKKKPSRHVWYKWEKQ